MRLELISVEVNPDLAESDVTYPSGTKISRPREIVARDVASALVVALVIAAIAGLAWKVARS